MSYETRAYDKPNDDGFPPDPIVILVATGTHDVSRLVNLLAGSRLALCEHGELAHQIRRQVKRHNGGRAALKLLADHGGPDLLEIPDRELAAEVKRLQDKVARDHDELRDKRTDLLNIRGILKPADRMEDVVPMPLGHMVSPAVEWLADNFERLRDAEQRVHRAFADADVEAVDLNAMTVAELTAFVMAALDGGDRS